MKRNIISAFLFVIAIAVILVLSANHKMLFLSCYLCVLVLPLFLAVGFTMFRVKVFAPTMHSIVNNNNWILSVTVVMFFAMFICGVLYGGGDPALQSAARDVKALVFDKAYDDKVQSKKNLIMRGISATDSQIATAKEYFAASKDEEIVRARIFPLEVSPMSTMYVQRAANHDTYGVFATDEEVARWLKGAEKEEVAVAEKTAASSVGWLAMWTATTGRSGFFWWATFYLFLLIIPSAVVSFHDEVADGLQKMLDKAKQIKEGNNSAPEESGDTSGAAATVVAKVKETVSGEGGLIMKILGVDIVSEMIQVLIKSLKRS